MRLEKLTIGSDKPGASQQFKNLKNVVIDFDESHLVTVLIGWNGTGKSNVLEALAIIFRDLIAEKRISLFAYKVSYRIGSASDERRVHIDADPDRAEEPLIVHVADGDALAKSIQRPGDEASADDAKQLLELNSSPLGRKLTGSDFRKAAPDLLPRYVFSYYSGESRRMYDVFRPYLESYDSELRSGSDPGFKRLFFALPVHSQFVLLAFLIQQSTSVREFLDEHLGIDPAEGVESVLFVLKQPPWKANGGDTRFWNARGVVQEFLDRLYSIALAPIRIRRRVSKSMWSKASSEFLYLYVKDMEALRELVGDKLPADFFRELESTYVSELIDEVLIRVRLKKNEGSVTFRELSEGEQQLLTVLGLLRFTAAEESLFLLDEPDTHLNPRWCVDYLNYLKRFVSEEVGPQKSSHIILTTHNPLAIAELERGQIQILQSRKSGGAQQIVASYPESDPRGQGYAAIVTSDMFGIASSLDRPTQQLLEEQRLYAGKAKLTSDELSQLERINKKLERLGYRFFLPDDEYSRFLRLRFERLSVAAESADPVALAAKVVSMTRDEREKLAEELLSELESDPAPSGGIK